MPLACTTLADQRIAPHRIAGPGRFEMGVYGADGRVEPRSLLHRSYARGNRFCLGVAAAPEGRPVRHFDRAIYGGMLVDHFGHFLTESLARLWYAAIAPDLPILLTLPRRMTEPRLEPWQAAILDLLGLRDRVVPLTGLVSAGTVHVPDPGYEIQFTFAPEHADFLGRIRWQPVAGRKLWLSRAGVKGPNQPAQTAIDAALRRDGWQVLHPETLSLPQQLALYASAERLAGEEGSALHGVMLLAGCGGLRMDMIVRDPRQGPAQVNANQATICARRGIDLRLHWVPGETVRQREGAHVDKVHAPPEAYVACLSGA